MWQILRLKRIISFFLSKGVLVMACKDIFFNSSGIRQERKVCNFARSCLFNAILNPAWISDSGSSLLLPKNYCGQMGFPHKKSGRFWKKVEHACRKCQWTLNWVSYVSTFVPWILFFVLWPSNGYPVCFILFYKSYHKFTLRL